MKVPTDYAERVNRHHNRRRVQWARRVIEGCLVLCERDLPRGHRIQRELIIREVR